MEQRVTMITLGVADLARSRAYYEALGWQPSMVMDEVVFFQIGGMALGLYGRAALAAEARVADDGARFSGMSLAHNVRAHDEVDAVLDQAVAAGGSLARAAEEASWGGYSGYFTDPDGHLWEVAWNPYWEIAADGSIQLSG